MRCLTLLIFNQFINIWFNITGCKPQTVLKVNIGDSDGPRFGFHVIIN